MVSWKPPCYPFSSSSLFFVNREFLKLRPRRSNSQRLLFVPSCCHMLKTVHSKHQLLEKKHHLIHGEATRIEKHLDFDLVSKRLLFSTTNSLHANTLWNNQENSFVVASCCHMFLVYPWSLPLRTETGSQQQLLLLRSKRIANSNFLKKPWNTKMKLFFGVVSMRRHYNPSETNIALMTAFRLKSLFRRFT